MKIIFHQDYYKSDYADNPSSLPERMKAVVSGLKTYQEFDFTEPEAASYEDILLSHTQDYIKTLEQNEALYRAACLAAGGTIKAAETAYLGTPSFAAVKPPGHHAYRSSGWGYCYFCNMSIALKYLRQKYGIKSAFVLDFDAHTGDGTKDTLSDWGEVKILNPFADDRVKYIKLIEEYIKNLPPVDIIGVCAGFDSYEKDVGRKLKTFDFYTMGVMMKQLAKKMGHNRRFATLEGGYFLPDLGKNVLAFCQGFG